MHIYFRIAALLTITSLLYGLPTVHTALATPPDTLTVDDILQELVESLDPEAEGIEELVEGVTELASHPVDLNEASLADLARIPTLDASVGARLVAVRGEYGPFDSIDQAFDRAEVDPETAARVRPFVTVRARDPTTRLLPRLPLDDIQVDVIQRLTRRIDIGRGFDDDTTRTTYLGGPERLYTRVRARASPHLAANLTLDKRPGEPFTWDPDSRTYGFNHVALNVSARRVGMLEALVIGDYTVMVGQGVTLWRPTAFGKGRETVRPVVRQGIRITPYGSTERNHFFRGAAAMVRILDGVKLTGFVSRKAVDATLEEDVDAEGAFVIASFPSSGLHRTSAERDRKGTTRAHVIGGAVTYAYGQSTIGLTAHRTRYDHRVQPDATPYRAFAFSGRQADIASLFGTLQLRSMNLFGEGARDHRGNLGGMLGLRGSLGDQGAAVVSLRHFPPDFVSLHGSTFGEGSGPPANETGIYTGLDLRLHARWRVAGYFDQFRFPWVRFAVPRPSSGHDALLLLEYRSRPGTSVYVQGRTKTRESGIVLDRTGTGIPIDGVAPETRQSARVHGSYQPSRRLRLQTRFEATRFVDADGTVYFGNLLFQDVRWTVLPSLQIDARLTFFDAEDFGARLFAYENDLLYTFSVPMLSGRGQRAYLLARWQPGNNITVEAKLAETRFEDVTTVGSGLDEVEGNRMREVRAQLRWRF